MTGLEKHMIEKDLIKFLRKHFNAGSKEEVVNAESEKVVEESKDE